MKVSDFVCRSWDDAVRLLGDQDSVKVCSNTTLERDGTHVVYVKLHGHRIAMFCRDGLPIYSHCGYPTNTTKQRLNRCLPPQWRVYQDKGRWHLWNLRTRETRPWYNGIILDGRTGE